MNSNVATNSPTSDCAEDYGFRHIAIAVDNSSHSNRAVEIGLAWARAFGACVTGSHAYAAKLHDLRFRQMEGGLPEQFRKEDELERQRDIHDTLITKGLGVITDSYLDVAAARARELWVPFERKSIEGKNYRAIVDDICASDYDLVALGSRGLGAVDTTLIGSVCERVARRVDRDLLVIKDDKGEFAGGPILVAVDGSPASFAGLQTALLLGRELERDVEVVSAFDPFFHYVAFNSIAGVLSDEAGKVFKFQEQEQLHEEIIDSGLAKIYQAHLRVAEKIAAEAGQDVKTTLLAGKPFEIILRHIETMQPSLLVIGRVGVHADDEMDIGGNAENLLRLVPCDVLLSSRSFHPPLEEVAAETTSWTEEAEQSMERVPSFVRNMARTAILRYAHEHGHTVVTSSIVDEAVGDLLPASAMQAMGMIAQAAAKRQREQAEATAQAKQQGAEATFDGRHVVWDDAATTMLAESKAKDNLKLRCEKLAHQETSGRVTEALVRRVLGESPSPSAHSELPPNSGSPSWTNDAQARLAQVPEGFMRDRSRQRIEEFAKRTGAAAISLEVAEAGLAEARQAMMSAFGSPQPSGPPSDLSWSAAAHERIASIPEGFMRETTIQRIEELARTEGLSTIDVELVERKYESWTNSSAGETTTMAWSAEATARIAKIPAFVRKMVVLEIERAAAAAGHSKVNEAIVETAVAKWKHAGFSHGN